jgi:hypothetical protein
MYVLARTVPYLYPYNTISIYIMSEPTIEAVAIALVVDSSLTIASEWIRILTEYVVPMLKRLGGVFSKYPVSLVYHAHCSLNLALVSSRSDHIRHRRRASVTSHRQTLLFSRWDCHEGTTRDSERSRTWADRERRRGGNGSFGGSNCRY